LDLSNRWFQREKDYQNWLRFGVQGSWGSQFWTPQIDGFGGRRVSKLTQFWNVLCVRCHKFVKSCSESTIFSINLHTKIRDWVSEFRSSSFEPSKSKILNGERIPNLIPFWGSKFWKSQIDGFKGRKKSKIDSVLGVQGSWGSQFWTP
jgi:hypothetical protein